MTRITTLRVAPEQLPSHGSCHIVNNSLVLPHPGHLAPVLLGWKIGMKEQAVPGDRKNASKSV
jgi:hypothetical protein